MSKKIMAEILVDAWAAERNMAWVVTRYAIEMGRGDLDSAHRYALAALTLGKTVWGEEPARAFAHKNMRRLSDIGWSNAPRERLLLAARQDLGIRNGAKGRVTVRARDLSKNHDWGVVK